MSNECTSNSYVEYEIDNYLFQYSPDTGMLYRRLPTSNEWKECPKHPWAGDKYRKVTINQKKYYQHRLIWKIMTGDWPNIIDHINGDKLDNRWENLRNVSYRDNLNNTKRHRNGRLPGTRRRNENRNLTKRWQSLISINGTCIYLGDYLTEQEAHEAYLTAREKYNV